jgi:hypothetical protein
MCFFSFSALKKIVNKKVSLIINYFFVSIVELDILLEEKFKYMTQFMIIILIIKEQK